MVRHVDMFCGIGGFGLAALRLGAETVWANDICPSAVKVYGANLPPAVPGDARAVAASVPPHDILTAGLPCQPFSSAGRRGGSADDRGTLFRVVAGALGSLRPVAFVVENVPNLPRVRGGRDFAAMLDAFGAVGYSCRHAVVNAADFGLAQNRLRLFVVGRLADPPLLLPPPPIRRATVADVLEPDPGERYDMHEATLARLPACARVDRLVGGVRVLWNQRGGSRMGYTVFGTDGLAPTLTASGSRHYERYLVGGRYRRLTPVEYARLQGFPDRWCDAAPHAMRYRLLGNAVPPPLAEWAMRAAIGL